MVPVLELLGVLSHDFCCHYSQIYFDQALSYLFGSHLDLFQIMFRMTLNYIDSLNIAFFVLVFNWNHFEMSLLNLRINFFIHCGLFFLILVVFLWRFFFHYVSAKFHLWPSSGDLPRPLIGMLSLVTISPVITAFHSCCLSHHVFWPSKPLAGLGRIWNHYLPTMLTWNRRDSTPLSAVPQAPKKKN